MRKIGFGTHGGVAKMMRYIHEDDLRMDCSPKLLKKNEIHVSYIDKSHASAIFGLELGFDVDFGAGIGDELDGPLHRWSTYTT